jgi:hypothetical protein
MPSDQGKAGDRPFTAYCGIYCKDCIPSDGALFKALDELIGHLDRVGLDEYARAIAKSHAKFNDYPVFLEVLGEIRKLECINFCREGGCRPDCRVRACAIGKGYEGCWECADLHGCELLRPLKDIHPSLGHNLEMIREHGVDDWSGWRGKHYKWHRERNHDESG